MLYVLYALLCLAMLFCAAVYLRVCCAVRYVLLCGDSGYMSAVENCCALDFGCCTVRFFCGVVCDAVACTYMRRHRSMLLVKDCISRTSEQDYLITCLHASHLAPEYNGRQQQLSTQRKAGCLNVRQARDRKMKCKCDQNKLKRCSKQRAQR